MQAYLRRYESLRGLVICPGECDPEKYIALSVEIAEDFIEYVGVNPLKRDARTLRTAELLEYVYNGGSTYIKDIECSNLRNEHLLPDIQRFIQFVNGHFNEPDSGYDELIKKEIDRSSKFSAFKRKIIRDDPNLSTQFSDALT